jgi:hypothetical protein
MKPCNSGGQPNKNARHTPAAGGFPHVVHNASRYPEMPDFPQKPTLGTPPTAGFKAFSRLLRRL